MINSIDIFIILLVLSSILFAFVFFNKIYSLKSKDNKEDKEIDNCLYRIKLYLSDGTSFIDEQCSKVVHWDNNIYILYDLNGQYIKKIHKGDNMLLEILRVDKL